MRKIICVIMMLAILSLIGCDQPDSKVIDGDNRVLIRVDGVVSTCSIGTYNSPVIYIEDGIINTGLENIPIENGVLNSKDYELEKSMRVEIDGKITVDGRLFNSPILYIEDGEISFTEIKDGEVKTKSIKTKIKKPTIKPKSTPKPIRR